MKAAAGNTIGTMRTIGDWCSSGSSVYSAIYRGGWAETSTPGWTAQSNLGRGSGIVSNQGRIWERHRLYFGTTWLNVQEVVLCPRVRGTSGGLNVGDNACTIY